MTDNEIKEDCLQEAGIDLGRYSYTELTEIKDALRRYHKTKLKLLGIADVNYCKPTYSDKNKMPDDVKYLFNKGVDLYQTIMNYELTIIGSDEFIEKMREIEKAYCS